ncbi:MAG TPA: DUF1801 domain-containing protein [Candidatus Thermoplasmatota archaeon]|nr:DUF1801 domain-containing protein [Candidatus Thermoplasmatota archaeon]
MATFPEAREALKRALFRVFPDAKPVPRWAGVETWGAPRPEAVVDHDAPGTYDPKLTVVGIADRKTGPVVYFLDPGDYFVLDTHKALLTEAGFKLGRGCIMHQRKAPFPAEALEELFRRVKERDAAAAAKAAEASPAKPAAKAAPKAPPKPKGEVDKYLAALPESQRAALERLRKQILAAAPKATEKIGYGMPGFYHEGPLVYMAAFRTHLSFFPGDATTTADFAAELEGYKVSKGTIQFTPEKPLPAALVKRIVKRRVAENEERAAARAAKKAPRKAPAKKAAAARTRKVAPAKRPRSSRS